MRHMTGRGWSVRVTAPVLARAAARTLAAFLALAGAASAQVPTPFLPRAAPKPKIVRLLAYPEYFDRRALDEFEHATGYAVGYDTYTLSVEIPDKWKEGPYDLVALPGPAIARRIAAGALTRLDRSRLPNARRVQSVVTSKLAPYDPAGVYAIPFGWSPFGLLYDADRVAARLGGAPSSWSALLDPRISTRLKSCGVDAPNARDGLFVAAWRLLGVDPARLRPLDIRSGAFVLARAKTGLTGFAIADPVGALARGAACLSAGTPGEAKAANARARAIGAKVAIVFAYAKEGGAVYVDSFAIPRDAPHPDIAYRLLDFLLRGDNASADAAAAGVVSSEDASQIEALKRLSPEGAYDERFAAALEAEWTHLRAAK